MTIQQRIDRAENSLWTDCFGDPIPEFTPYLPSMHGLVHSLLWDIANRNCLRRGQRWVGSPVAGWRTA